MAKQETSKKKFHVVCVPATYQSHVGAMLKLAKLLYSRGDLHITFVTTEFNQRRLLKIRGSQAFDGFPGFQFWTIPNGLPPSGEDKAQDDFLMCEAIVKYMSSPFCDLLDDLNNQSTPVSCVISDDYMSFTTDVAKERFSIPDVHFYPLAACCCLSIRHFRALKKKGLTPLKGTPHCFLLSSSGLGLTAS